MDLSFPVRHSCRKIMQFFVVFFVSILYASIVAQFYHVFFLLLAGTIKKVDKFIMRIKDLIGNRNHF